MLLYSESLNECIGFTMIHKFFFFECVVGVFLLLPFEGATTIQYSTTRKVSGSKFDLVSNLGGFKYQITVLFYIGKLKKNDVISWSTPIFDKIDFIILLQL